MRAAVGPGVSTAELNAVGAAVLTRLGGRSAPMLVYDFPAEFCISVNDEVVHGIPSRRTLGEGDLVKLDVTVEKGGYMADTALTVAVGRVTPEQQTLADATRRAFAAAMRMTRAGGTVRDIGRAVEDEARRAGVAVVRELTGHGIGRTIHEPPDVPNFDDPRGVARLSRGLVITVEPIFALGRGDAVLAPDGWTVRTADRTDAAHFEHTLVITESEPILVTAAA
jgi:methionyl aminopeptidase